MTLILIYHPCGNTCKSHSYAVNDTEAPIDDRINKLYLFCLKIAIGWQDIRACWVMYLSSSDQRCTSVLMHTTGKMKRSYWLSLGQRETERLLRPFLEPPYTIFSGQSFIIAECNFLVVEESDFFLDNPRLFDSHISKFFRNAGSKYHHYQIIIIIKKINR